MANAVELTETTWLNALIVFAETLDVAATHRTKPAA